MGGRELPTILDEGGAIPMILRWGGGGGHFQYFWMGGVVHVMQRKSGSRLDMSPL